MSDCGQELCEGWTGEGCACAVFGIEFAISGLTQQELHGPLEPPATVCVRLDGLADKIAAAVHDEICGCDNGPAGREARVSARLLTLLQSLAVQ